MEPTYNNQPHNGYYYGGTRANVKGKGNSFVSIKTND